MGCVPPVAEKTNHCSKNNRPSLGMMGGMCSTSSRSSFVVDAKRVHSLLAFLLVLFAAVAVSAPLAAKQTVETSANNTVPRPMSSSVTVHAAKAAGSVTQNLPDMVVTPEAIPAWAHDPEFIGPIQHHPFALLGERIMPGTMKRMRLSLGQGFSGDAKNIPVIVVHGHRPGPVICLTGAVHGDELNGVEVIRRVMDSLDPDTLIGTVVAMPVVNLFGYTQGSRYLPDRRDLNRHFPGSRHGSVAARIARAVFDDVVAHCSGLVDFHTGSFKRSNMPQVRADLTNDKVLAFSRGFGATPVLQSKGAAGMLRTAATQAGIAALTFEIGAPGRLQGEDIAVAEVAVGYLLHHQGMSEQAQVAADPPPVFYDSFWVRANHGGLLYAHVSLGERVSRNQVLGQVIDPLKNTVDDIKAPKEGRVLGMSVNQLVLPGYAVFHLGMENQDMDVGSDCLLQEQIDVDSCTRPNPAGAMPEAVDVNHSPELDGDG